MMRRHPETAIHIAVVQWMRAVAPQCVIFHVPNGEWRDKRQAAKLKAMGTLAGVPDIAIIDGFGRPFFVEVKGPSGSVSKEQKAVLTALADRGVKCAVCRSIDDAREAFRVWGIPMREVVG